MKKEHWGIKLIQDENIDKGASTDGQTEGPTRRESKKKTQHMQNNMNTSNF